MNTPPRAATRGYFGTMPAVEEFRRQHRGWRMLPFEDGPLYALPAEAVAVLARAAGPGRPVLSAAEAAHEIAFTKFCQIPNALGVWDWGWVSRTPLHPVSLTVEDVRKYAAANGTPAAEVLAWEKRLLTRQAADARATGYVGRLLVDRAFLDFVAGLRFSWERFPPEFRPEFPLLRLGDPRADFIPPPGAPARVAKELGLFHRVLASQLDEWGLSGLAAWDLPCPLVPSFADPWRQEPFEQNRYLVRLVIPYYYPVRGADELAALVRKEQKRLAAEARAVPLAAGLPHWQAWATLFDVLHLERSIRQRAEADTRGLVVRVDEAASRCFGITKERVKKYRKAISGWLRGIRTSGPPL